MRKKIEIIKKLHDSDHGAVGIVVAILLIGLFISILAMIQTFYVPLWMEQSEAGHMQEVANQFSMLKYAVDTQVLVEKSNPISTPIELGNKEMPFLPSSRSFGSLDILPDQFLLSVCTTTNTYSNYSIGIIKYSSDNAYFLDQSYVSEAGAIIMDQSKGNIMTIRPSFSAEVDEGAAEINMVFDITNISAVEEKTSVSGYGTYPIKTEFQSSFSPELITSVKNITITTNYANAWKIFLNQTLSVDFQYDTHYTITDNIDGFTIEFLEDNNPNLLIRITNIKAQVGPGWV